MPSNKNLDCCEHCHNNYYRANNPKQKFCSDLCRVWGRINKGEAHECWEWTGELNDSGYGIVRLGNKIRTAHRLIYEMTYGPPGDGMCVCHKCDNRKCANPSHLWLGTNRDNVRDRSAKGRSAAAVAKLSFEIAEKIRAEYAKHPESQRVIADRYGVRPQSINKIIRNEAWQKPRPLGVKRG